MKKIQSLGDLYEMSNKVQHILTLFSGGLDSTYVLESLKGVSAKVTALVVDVGDTVDEDELYMIARHYDVELKIVDAKKDFAEQSLVRAIQSQAYYFGDYPVSSSLSRPILIQKAVELANELGCDAIIHTANQSQNSLRRLNGALGKSDFKGFYGSPYQFSALSRESKKSALVKSGLKGFESRVASGDSNLWCREFESGVLDDPENFDVPESLFIWSIWNPEFHLLNNEIKVSFENGCPKSINGLPFDIVDMVDFINTHVGSYEIGRYIGFDHLEEDEKVLEVREAPAATILMKAYKLLEISILPTDLLKIKAMHNDLWTQEAVEGRWDSMLQKASYAFISSAAKEITGSVKFKLSRGQALANSIVAENPKYIRDRDGWEIMTTEERCVNFSNSGFKLTDFA
ncbi:MULTISPECIES: argininosuccinate synthase-related protein [unclassified Halomonas]|uniref:argininosuccinate synthase-related protein n=1 Tax=unclassified Halomonas TaxID=2609666 RepID=UPI000550ED99|nr:MULTISPECIES: argininosuccinate synthase-related protein [unclassified Halomonas]CEP34387.1 Argininosuccinate synthase [Halomonas sp. R57-5]